MMKRILTLFLIIFLGLSLAHFFVSAHSDGDDVSDESNKKLEIIYFWGDGCPHCAKEKLFLDNIEKKYPELEIKRYEVWYNEENQKLFQEYVQKYNIQQLGVPLTVIGDKFFIGYQDDETTGKAIEGQIKIISGKEEPEGKGDTVKLPIFGEINLSKLSLPVLAITLGAVDGFNPCAMWILLFLIALLINTRSRKKLWLVGGTFILASGLFYFLILAGWLKLFLAIGYLGFIRTAVGIFALGFGVWQVREFIYFQPGVCKVLGLKPKLQQGLAEKAQRIINSPLTIAALGGLLLLVVSVNLIEFFCSAGLPALFTGILSLNSLPPAAYYFYLLLYTLFFILDDLLVFSLAIITLRKVGFTEKYNRWSTLIGGLLILILGILLIFKPGLLMFAP